MRAPAEIRHAFDDDAPVGAQLDARAHALQEQRQLEHLRLGGGAPDHRLALGQRGRQQRRLGGADARVGELDDAAAQPAATGRDALVGHLDLGAEGPQGLDVEVDGPAAELVAADAWHEGLAGQMQQGPEQQHGNPVEPAERQRNRRVDLLGGVMVMRLPARSTSGADRP